MPITRAQTGSLTTGVIIGRFQTPYLHAGHLTLIGTALQECDDVVILLGSQEEKDERNPYSFEERAQMIYKVFRQVQIIILPDVKEDNEEWSKRVDSKIEFRENPILYHSRDSFKDCYSGKYPLKEIPELQGYSATKIRNDANKITEGTN